MNVTRIARTRRHAIAAAMACALAGSTLHASPRVASRAEPERVHVPRGARYLIDVGRFSVSDDGASTDLAARAREAVLGRLALDGAVVVDSGDANRGDVERVLRRHHLRGYFIDGRVHVVSGLSTSRVEVSLVVQTHPGREYRFESAVSVTLAGGDAAQRGASLEAATRRAVVSATTRALGQLEAG